MAKADESIIQQAKREWEEANARGDEEGKRRAHEKAEAERAKEGYSGGSTGDERIAIEPKIGTAYSATIPNNGPTLSGNANKGSSGSINPGAALPTSAPASTPTMGTVSVPTLNSSRTLQYNTGRVDNDVKSLQHALNSLGYTLDEDGIFGNKTKAAVEDYQRKNGLLVDGIVGSQTYGSLNTSLAGLNKPAPTNQPVSGGTQTTGQPSQPTTQGAQGTQGGSNQPASTPTLGRDTNDYLSGQNAASRGMSQEDMAELERLSEEWYKARDEGNQQAMNEAHDAAQRIRAKYGYSGGGSGNENIGIATNKPVLIWRANISPNGDISFNKDGLAGTMTTDANGNITYAYDDGIALQNGDAIPDESTGGWLYWDAARRAFVDQQTWMDTYMKKDPSDMNQDELLNFLYDTIYDNFTDSTELEDFLTWAEAQGIAREYYNPIYNESLEQSMDDITKKALQSGFYGQLPTEALRAQAVQSAEVQKATAINDLALSLMNDDRDTAIAKMEAQIEAKQFDLDSILDLIALAERYNTEGGTPFGTTGMTSGGAGPMFTAPSTGDVGNGNAGDTGNAGNGGRGGGAPTYNNGSLTPAQVEELQRALGVPVDRYYGPQSRSAAGGIDADEAYRRFVVNRAADTASLGQVDTFNNIVSALSSGDVDAAQRLIDDNWEYLTAEQQERINSYLGAYAGRDANGRLWDVQQR